MLKLEAIGYLGKDATVNQVNGKHVLNFTVAHSEKFTDKQGNKVDKTTWVECSRWSDNAPGVAPYLKKGTLVYIQGTPEVATFEDRSGTTRASLRCRVLDLQLLGGKKEDGAAQNNSQTQKSQQPAAQAGGYQPAVGEDDDLPF